MTYWLLIIFGTIIIALGLSKEFFLLISGLLNNKDNFIKYNIAIRILLIFFGLITIFFGLFLESIN